MKKLMRKVLALVASMVMVLAISVPAMAASITVDGVKSGETYKAYKVLNVEVTGEGEDALYKYSIPTTSTALKSILETGGLSFTQEGNNYVVTNAGTIKSASTLTAALKAAEAAGTLTESVALGYATETTTADKQAIFQDLAKGEWYVSTTTGSVVSLATVDAQKLTVDKNEASTVDKKVQETSTNVGDTVHYKATIDGKKGATIKFTDTLSEGLTLDAQTGLSVTGVDANAYSVKTWDTTADASKIEIDFNELSDDATIVITYTATVNSSALSKDKVTNEAKIEYGNQQNTSTTETKLFKFDIDKVDGNNNSKLSDVKFTLTKTDNGTTYYYDGTSVWTETETKLETDENGAISVKGIAAGTYTLTETDAKAGYNKLTDSLTVTINNEGDVSITGNNFSTATNGTIQIKNYKGSILPSTGGMGTTIFYVLGATLVIGAGVVLVTRRRLSR